MKRSRRNRLAGLAREPSYFTTCKWCRAKIHLRQMEQGQWVPFDGTSNVHRCPNQGDYNYLEKRKASRRYRGPRTGTSLESASGATPPYRPVVSDHPVDRFGRSIRNLYDFTPTWVWIALTVLACLLLVR